MKRRLPFISETSLFSTSKHPSAITFIRPAGDTRYRRIAERIARVCAENIAPVFSGYGLELAGFSIANLEIPEDDPNRGKLEAAIAAKAESRCMKALNLPEKNLPRTARNLRRVRTPLRAGRIFCPAMRRKSLQP
jgi:hypothetical protein